MKKLPISFAIALIFWCGSCAKKEVKTELTSEDLAAYLDTQAGILFTTAENKTEVLTKLKASPYEGGYYTLPILEYEGKTVLYIFQLEEVERPWEFENYKPTDICMDEVFQDFEIEITRLIDRKVPNLRDHFFLACGKLAGELEEGINDQFPLEKGNEKETLEKRQVEKDKLNEFKEKLLKNAQEKGEAAEKALKEGDPEAAKKEGEELKEKAKDDYYLDFDYCKEKLWNFSFGLRYKYELNEEIPPELIKEFEHEFIKYKVYKSAACQDGPATMARVCTQEIPMILGVDTLNRPIQLPPKWVSDEYFPRKVCRIGTGLCVEQEVVIGARKVYSDANCERLIHIWEYRGFSCFDR